MGLGVGGFWQGRCDAAKTLESELLVLDEKELLEPMFSELLDLEED